MLTTTTTKSLDRMPAILRGRLMRAVCAAGFVATLFLTTMSATEHMARAAMSGEGISTPVSETANVEAKSTARKSATQATREDYQQREQSSKDLTDFQGGSAGIYIGGSTAAVILLLVLLIILL